MSEHYMPFIGAEGTLSLPVEAWKRLGVGPGDKVYVDVDEDCGMRIYASREHYERALALREYREYLQLHKPEGVDLAQDFLAWRREEARREESRF